MKTKRTESPSRTRYWKKVNKMKDLIINKLEEIEKTKRVNILFAVESGSRAWGFESPDSDYDIRFVYKKDIRKYLSLWEENSTIQFMTEEDLDGVGWDLQKASKLLAKSNASFLGWLFSPIVYFSHGETLEKMRSLANENFNPVSGFYHFHSMNKGFHEKLEAERFTIKEFFYAIRTALCANWILKNKTIPPVLFTELFELISNHQSKLLLDLVQLKASTAETGIVSIHPDLLNMAKTIVLENESKKNSLKKVKLNSIAFNEFFINEVL